MHLSNPLHIDFNQLGELVERHHTERFALRPFALSDAWPLFLASKIPAFNENLLWKAPEDFAEMVRRAETIHNDMRLGRMRSSSIVVRETGEFVGVLRYFPSLVAELAEAVEFGLWLHPNFWQGRVGPHVSTVLVHALFNGETRVRHVVARVSKDNKAANKSIVGLGFSVVSEGVTFREDGSVMEVLNYAMSREEWTGGALVGEAGRRFNDATSCSADFNDRRHPFRADRGRRFSVMVDDHGRTEVTGRC